MTLGDLKGAYKKSEYNKTTRNNDQNGDIFDQRWNTFLIDVREDNNTKKADTYYENNEWSLPISTFHFCIIYDKNIKN